MRLARYLAACLLFATLSGCATVARLGDPKVAALAGAIGRASDSFFSAMIVYRAAGCDVRTNAQGLARLAELAAQLRTQISANPASPELVRASNALDQALADAREAPASATKPQSHARSRPSPKRRSWRKASNHGRPARLRNGTCTAAPHDLTPGQTKTPAGNSNAAF